MKPIYGIRPRALLGSIFAIGLVSLVLIVGAEPASAATSVSQCNGTDNVGGQAVECHYTITNNLNGSVTSSTVTLTECHGAANAPATMVCTTTTTSSTDLVTAVDQCNGSGNGGGGTVECTVDIVNNITGTSTPSSATVNQCNSAGTGGGTPPTILCSPFPANTTNATVTQCNSSGNGGGGTERVQCTVNSDASIASVLNVTVNQCIGSGNGGGATVTCRTGITTNVTAPAPSPTPTPSPTTTPTPTPTASPTASPTAIPTPTRGSGGGDKNDTNGPGAGNGNDNGGSTSTSTLTTAQVERVPDGSVGAGGGSTSGLEHVWLGLLGLILLLAVGPIIAIRRRSRDQV
jgi:hypothetical protein